MAATEEEEQPSSGADTRPAKRDGGVLKSMLGKSVNSAGR
ncbi:hypothetical protein HMPREF9080_01089 [Cardiobacterium valvarum F0432]|uniref:Uncharacterized protein n=1 Tax=Cardiobacterium valvarum F0432 TaxID=797473 RepID=G9ZEA1_9GAMM|nr:hypothetical protein HMPREF9080_01089 [Cardiobacterium valvarum F0432]